MRIQRCIEIPRIIRILSFLIFLAVSSSTVVQGVDQDSACTTTANDGTCLNNDSQEEDDNCIDHEDQCLFWAEYGECSNNVAYMTKACAQSCEICVRKVVQLPFEVNDSCQDDDPRCKEWADSGECFANPSYMKVSCRLSCHACVNPKELHKAGLSPDEIMQRFRYAESNWGPNQTLGTTPAEKSDVIVIVQAMMDYALLYVTKLPLSTRILCTNEHPDCAARALNNECETNLPFMMINCPLACQLCDKSKLYQRCVAAVDVDDIARRKDPWISGTGLQTKLERLKNLGNPDVMYEGKEPDDPWVLKWDNFLSPREISSLMTLAKGLSWSNSSLVASSSLKEFQPVRRTSTSAYCKDCTNTAYQNLQKSLSTLVDASLSFMEPLEFVHYNSIKMQSFGMHHDVSPFDLIMPAGPRVLTLFVCLTDVPANVDDDGGGGAGGAMGFPNLDWLSVPPKKGQLLIWPNVLNTDPTQRNAIMMSEGLPVIKGEKYGLYTWIRLYNYTEAEGKGCV